jgi:DNA adenine methylase
VPLIVPPIKCQGIKTRLVEAIRSLETDAIRGRWIEPFCGSCVVAFNIQPERALLCDSNEHIIRFYSDIQKELITGNSVRKYLVQQGADLAQRGEEHYYEIREHFNREPNSLAFLFLNRACFNGVMRFNRKGGFNVPFCRKPQRFARAYVTKIVNQVERCADILRTRKWVFRKSDFRATLALAAETDLIYADPPYAGRHVDYFNSWSDRDERDLAAGLKQLPCKFVLSTWWKNKYRTNPNIEQEWIGEDYRMHSIEHFYHVGPTETLRNSMTEALISSVVGCPSSLVLRHS